MPYTMPTLYDLHSSSQKVSSNGGSLKLHSSFWGHISRFFLGATLLNWRVHLHEPFSSHSPSALVPSPPKKRKLSTHIWMLQFGRKKSTLVHMNFTTKEMDGSEQAWNVDLDKISPPRNHQTWWSWNRLTLTSKNWPRKFAGPPPP